MSQSKHGVLVNPLITVCPFSVPTGSWAGPINPRCIERIGFQDSPSSFHMCQIQLFLKSAKRYLPHHPQLLSRTVFNPNRRLCHFLTSLLLQVWTFWNQATRRPIFQLNGKHILFGEIFVVASQKMRRLCPPCPLDVWNFQSPRMCTSDNIYKRIYHGHAQGHTQFPVNELDPHTFPSHSKRKLEYQYDIIGISDHK